MCCGLPTCEYNAFWLQLLGNKCFRGKPSLWSIFNVSLIATLLIDVFQYSSSTLLPISVKAFVHLTWFLHMVWMFSIKACEMPFILFFYFFKDVYERLDGTLCCIKKPSCTVCHACRGTEAYSYVHSLPHSSTLIKQLPPQPGCSRESTTLLWTGLFLAGMDCERALVLFQSYWLCLKHHNYLVPFERAESFSSSVHPPHGWTKGDLWSSTAAHRNTQPGFCSVCNVTSVS